VFKLKKTVFELGQRFFFQLSQGEIWFYRLALCGIAGIGFCNELATLFAI
jgi:hypothetical protein